MRWGIMLELLMLLLAVLVLPCVLYLVGARSRDAWGLIRKGEVKVGPSLYRAAPVTVWARGAAPFAVRVAAFTSFLLGQMIIPGALAALVGFVALVETLSKDQPNIILIVLMASAPTGLIVAGRLLGVGLPLLQRRVDAPDKARRTARWEIWHNALLLGGLAFGLAGGRDEQLGGLVIAIPAVLAIAHGVLLQRAAATVEAYDAEQEESGAPSLDEGLPAAR